MSSTALGAGDIVAERYRIEGLLGQGGMGFVYRAVQLSMGRAVALKLLPADMPATTEHIERFEREAQALARLQHPSTVRLFDFGTLAPGRPFIVMELLSGADLQEELSCNGPMRYDQALRVCQRVLGSLGEAHALGIIHRDVKPANVYLCASGPWPAVKLLDFGIAGWVELASTRKLTATGTVLGSAPYMSPEQAQGHPVGPAADLYALGVLLFEMLTGRTPFEGRSFTAQLVAKVLEPAPGVLEARPGLALPAGVCELVDALLQRDVRRRPASASAVGERIAALLEGHPSPAPEERPLPVRRSAAPLARTEPMHVPPTLTDRWVPPSAAASSSRPSRRRRSPWVAALLVLPALAPAWWAREGHSPSPPAGAVITQAPMDEPSAGADAGAATDAGAEAGPGDAAAEGSSDEGAPQSAVRERASARVREAGLDKKGERASARVREAGLDKEGERASGAGQGRERPAPRAAGSARATALPAGAAGSARATPPRPARPERAAAESASRGAERHAGVSSGAPAPPAPGVAAPAPPEAAAPGAAPAGAVLPGTLLPGAAPSSAAPSSAAPLPSPALPAAVPQPPPPRAAPAETWRLPNAWEPAARPPAAPYPERPARWLLRRYPTVAAARDAVRAGEITPSERNLIIAELRQARQRDRGRAIRRFRAGYLDREELRARLRDIDRRYEGAFEPYPRAGIHLWP